MQNQKSKIHKQTYKITPPKGMKQSLENMFFCFIIVVFRAVHWVSHHVPKRPKKKSREFPLGGPGKTGLAPCRQCTFFFLFGCFFFFLNLLFFANLQIQTPKSKIQKSKLQNPESKIKAYIKFWFMTGPQKKMDKYIFANSWAQRAKYQSDKVELTKKVAKFGS